MLKPRPYQITGRDFLAARSRALLADEMRVGKTPQAILAAEEKFGGGDVLVLCPAIAVPHWHREWDKWAPDSQITLDVMSFDRARNMWNAGTLQPRRYDVMIVDEAHFCKNPEAQRTKMVYGKGGLGYQVGAIWALSGTPATKHAGELWPMLRAFGATNMDYDAFVDRYCSYWWHKTRRERIIKGTREDKVSELRELLKPIMLRRTRAEVAPDMPEIDFQFLEIAPQPFDLPDIMSKGMTDEMLLAAIGGRNDLFPNDRQQVALQKIGPLAEEIAFAIENDLLKQTVVFGWHVEPLQQLMWMLNRRYNISAECITGQTSAKRREDVQDSFLAGKTQVVCANIVAAGTAIDLSAASHAYFLELDWVPGNNAQAASRLVSVTKKEKVTVDVVSWPGSVDERVQRVLTQRVRELSQLL